MANDIMSTTSTSKTPERGMIFWFDPKSYSQNTGTFISKSGATYKSYVQGNRRPYLVVSNNKGNSSSPTCNVVPITSENKTHIPTHVYYKFKGQVQTILVEQVRTIDSAALEAYMYTLPENIMNKVDEAIHIQFFGVKPPISQPIPESLPQEDWRDLVNSLQNVIDRILDVKMEKPMEPTKTETTVSPNELSPEPKENKPVSQVEKFYARYPQTKPQAPTTEEPKVQESVNPTPGRGRNKWTTERREAFLRDFDRLSPQEMMKSYNISTIQSLFSTKYNCKVALGRN